MNLAILTTSVSRNAGGLFLSVRNLTHGLDSLDVNCTISCMEDEHTAEDLNEWAPLKINAFSRKGPIFFPISQSMLKAVIESKPDILHCHGIWLYPSVIDLAVNHKLKIPYVISPRGMLDSWALQNSAWKKKLAGWLFEKRHLRKAACIHALCESEADSIREYGLKNPVAIIPNGVELPKNRLMLEIHGSRKKRILFLGRIHPKKGISELLQAWKQFSNGRPASSESWQLLIAGWDDGGHLGALQQLASDLGIQWSVFNNKISATGNKGEIPTSDLCFLGPLFGQEKDDLFRTVDAFILPSFSEGLPMSILEAWSYGLPVLMTDSCNIPEGFAAKAALRIEPNAKSITHGLNQLVDLSVSDLEAMGANGRKLIEQKFTWNKIAQDMKTVYDWCLGGNKPDCVLDI